MMDKVLQVLDKFIYGPPVQWSTYEERVKATAEIYFLERRRKILAEIDSCECPKRLIGYHKMLAMNTADLQGLHEFSSMSVNPIVLAPNPDVYP